MLGIYGSDFFLYWATFRPLFSRRKTELLSCLLHGVSELVTYAPVHLYFGAQTH